MTADCDARRLYVVDRTGVVALDLDSDQAAARFAKPGAFAESLGTAALDAAAGELYVPGLWQVASGDWLVKPIDRMYDGDGIGYRLDLRTGRTSRLVGAVERGCWSLGPNCLYATLDRVTAPGGGWIAAHRVGMLVGVYDSAARLVRTVDVRSPLFLESGARNSSTSFVDMVAWDEDNSIIRRVFSFGDKIVTVHSFNRTQGWTPGTPTNFNVYMNVHSITGAGLRSDRHLPDLPVGRDATALYVIDYGPSGRRSSVSGPITLFRIPVDQ